jgi:uncharacterized protein YqjF (DUF2071 family)
MQLDALPEEKRALCEVHPPYRSPGNPGNAARERMLSRRCEPLFVADWLDVLMMHYEVERAKLQRVVPFDLDLFQGRAFVSLVFFVMNRMRPHRGGRLANWLCHPIGRHEFLNVRSYVQQDGEPGIFFLAEWLPNALSVRVGPLLFGLPYRLGRMRYHHQAHSGRLAGRVIDAGSGACLSYDGQLRGDVGVAPCPRGSLDEWLMERYTAYTDQRGVSRFFRVWHSPRMQTAADVELIENALLRVNWPWLSDAACLGAHYSAGLRGVWMGWPHHLPCCGS